MLKTRQEFSDKITQAKACFVKCDNFTASFHLIDAMGILANYLEKLEERLDDKDRLLAERH